MSQRFRFLWLLFLIPGALFAQKSPDPYQRDWKQADSLLNQGLPQSARKLAERVYDRASREGQPVQVLKAQLYLINLEKSTSEDADSSSIGRAEVLAKTSPAPYNAVWQSIAAQQYWNYYQQHRWQLYGRTRTATAPADFENWDASRFIERISQLFGQSVRQREALKAIPIQTFDPVLVPGVNTRHLRPTLYDLLAFRALAFWEWDEKDLPRPAYAFTMDDPAVFAPAAEFARHRFSTRDTASLQFRALEEYQYLLRLHEADATTDARIDADLHRLEFALQTSVLPDKKARYEAALARLTETYPGSPTAALAAYRLAVSRYDGAEEPPVLFAGDDAPRDTANRADYVALKAALAAIVAAHPKSEGGFLAAQRLQQLSLPSMSLQTEEAVLPGEPSKVLLTYRNTPKVFIRVVAVTPERWQTSDAAKGVTAAWLATQRPLQSFSTSLPGIADYREHRTELKLEALPSGLYAAVYSSAEDPAGNGAILGYAVFNVTNLAVVTQGSGPASGFVLHRKTGAPQAGATVTLYQESWNGGSYTRKPVLTTTADKAGAFAAGSNTAYQGLQVSLGTDRFYSREYLSFYRERPETPKQTRAFLFTDRSIYRPGQTVYFKAILLQQSDRGRKADVLAKQAAAVTFFDANGQKIGTQQLTSNDWGSVAGSFTAPAGGLTGGMHLEAVVNGKTAGTASISVEEYKRPTFRVTPDTLREVYALNQPVTVSMRAESYAGAPVGGAQVRYRVVREARLPLWWYRPGPRSPQAELLQGTVTTDASGAFTVSFTTLPDPTVAERSLPVFTYTVYADVTDLNGETRSATQSLQAGYRSLQLEFGSLPERALATDLDSLSIQARNLNGTLVAVPVTLRIERLQQPGRVYRKRLWAAPDQYVIPEEDFRKAFPLDEYRSESDYHTWTAAETVYETRFGSDRGALRLPGVFKQNGWYRIVATATDKAGKTVEEQRWVNVWAGAGPVADALVVVPREQTRQPGEEATVQVASGFGDGPILQQAQDKTGGKTPVWNAYSGAPLRWQQRITEADRGGLAVRYLMVRENRVYAEDAVIAVPWTNKELNLTWETHRDKLQPGAAETWTVVVRGAQQDQVAAEVAATLYDASLDAFRPHNWMFGNLFPVRNAPPAWNLQLGFGVSPANGLAWAPPDELPAYEKSYDALPDEAPQGMPGRYRSGKPMRYAKGMAEPALAARQGVLNTQQAEVAMDASAAAPAPPTGETAGNTQPEAAAPPLRKNLQETAFFFPQLHTDATGAVRLTFTIPEALTEWKLLAVAHTKDLATGTLSGTVRTQKDLMVVPGLPRFFRQGDSLFLSAKINNLSDRALSGTATLQIADALTGKPLDAAFRLRNTAASFAAPQGGSAVATWALQVPESRYEPVLVRISATAGAFTDGEESALPVVTNRTLVTETLPLWLNGAGTKNVTLDKLLQTGTANSGTLAPHALTLEYTANPAWYAVQALPYLMDYPYECAEQTFNRYYANALAAHILEGAPRVREIFRSWEEADTAALLSNLQKNEALKSALLEETPWVLDAQNEAQQRRNIARLFETAKLARGLDEAARKLEDMLLPEGGFPWFRGDTRPDRYITQYIVTGMGRLQKLGVADRGGRMARLAARCLPYLDRMQERQYEALVRNKAKLDASNIGPLDVQYLYLRSTLNKEFTSTAQRYYLGQAKKYWPQFNAYTKGMTALTLHRTGDAATTKTILQSLRETAQHNEEGGTHWMDYGRSWWWHEAPIEAQALLIECFSEAGRDTVVVDEARRWLLKQKQTQSWATTRATADAVYALLRTGSDWLQAEPQVTVQLGDTSIRSTDGRGQAGTGYFKVRIPGAAVRPEMGRVTLTVASNNASAGKPSNQPSWGALYWQYFENLDKITAAASPLTVRKQFFIERATERGPELQPVTGSAALKTGDKVTVRIEISTDRDLEYVHLKDARASCLEPVNVLSGYRWQGSLGYYESTRDVSSNFFIAYLPKGKYVFEYPLFATQAGTFSAGIATIQCLYAPEFAAHSEGTRLQVAPR